jgi:3-hydroxyisobutyrate dehydrogenase-like beta-hydroxyacid dehydrogenase
VTDDIVTRLRIIHCAADDLTPCGTCLICQAADEIERMRESSNRWQATAAGLSEDIGNAEDEIERLRAAGDALAECLRYWADFADQGYPDDDALRTWQEARRG